MVRVLFLTVGLILLSSCSSDETCLDCQQEKCSDLLQFCEKEAGCACMADCVGKAGIPGVDGCLGECGLAERPPSYLPVDECMATACPDSDECSVPAGYTVPSAAGSGGSQPVAGTGGSTPVAGSGGSQSAAGTGGSTPVAGSGGSQPAAGTGGSTPVAGSGGSNGSNGTAGIGGGELSDCSFDPGLAFNAVGEVLQLQSADGAVCARLERRNDGPGSLANVKWTLLDIRVGPLEQVALVDDPSAICWYSSHHNFADWAHAWTGTRRFDLKLREDGHGGARTYELHVFEQGPVDPGACAPLADGTEQVGDPIPLFPVNP